MTRDEFSETAAWGLGAFAGTVAFLGGISLLLTAGASAGYPGGCAMRAEFRPQHPAAFVACFTGGER